MNWQSDYQKKLMSVEQAASLIKSGDTIAMPAACNTPIDLVRALEKRYLDLENVTIVSGQLMYPVDYLKAEYKGHIGHHSIFVGPVERLFMNQGNIEVTSYQFSETDSVFSHTIRNNVLIMECAPPDEKGYLSYGPIGTFANDAWKKNAEKVIVQINSRQPYVYGYKSSIHLDEVDAICEADHELPEIKDPPIGEAEKRIAGHIIDMIPDGATIQLGLGNIADAVGYGLDDKKDLGVYTEMLTNSMVHMAKKGVINCSRKTFHPGKITAGFGIGKRELYDFMHLNPMVETMPIADITNMMNIARNNDFISVNNALIVDTTGQVCSESLGFNMFSSTGGLLDFVRGTRYSNGGMSFIALKSTADTKDGTISKIDVKLPPGTIVSVPRTDVQFIVTEYGVANLKNKSIEKRVQSMIAIAHPDFQDELAWNAKKAGLFSGYIPQAKVSA